MTKEEIKEYLKENLSIELCYENACIGGGGGIQIKLLLEGEFISGDYIYEAH